jgi:hypothetical protein
MDALGYQVIFMYFGLFFKKWTGPNLFSRSSPFELRQDTWRDSWRSHPLTWLMGQAHDPVPTWRHVAWVTPRGLARLSCADCCGVIDGPSAMRRVVSVVPKQLSCAISVGVTQAFKPPHNLFFLLFSLFLFLSSPLRSPVPPASARPPFRPKLDPSPFWR